MEKESDGFKEKSEKNKNDQEQKNQDEATPTKRNKILKKKKRLKSIKKIIERSVSMGANQILEAFESKLAYDKTKQNQIDKIHSELQSYKTDLIAKTNRPIINGIIKLYTDMGNLIKYQKQKISQGNEADFLFDTIEDFRDDILLLLDHNVIVSFEEHEEEFNPRRQRIINIKHTSEKEKNGNVAERIRPGFEQGKDMLHKESVCVYKFDDSLLDNTKELT